MKQLIQLLFLVFFLDANSQEILNYKIIINGQSYDIGLGKEYNFTSKEGTEFNYILLKSDTLTFMDNDITFKYPQFLNIDYPIQNDTAEIISLVNISGAIIIEKKKEESKIETLEEKIVRMTFKKVQNGFTMNLTDFEKELNNGIKMKGKNAVLTYDDIELIYRTGYVELNNKKIFLSTIENELTEQKKIDFTQLFWETIENL